MMKLDPRQWVTLSIVSALKNLCTICLVVGLSACAPAPNAVSQLMDYEQRIARTLERPAQEFQQPSHAPLPALRSWQQQVPRISVSLLDSWRLDQCRAGAIIAQRNSSLGKLEQGVSRLHTDLRLVSELQACIARLQQSDKALAQRLAKALAAKRQTLAAARQQALMQDQALRYSLRFSAKSLAAPRPEAFAQALGALEVVLATLQAEPGQQPSVTALDSALAQLHQSDYLPRLWQTMAQQQAYLRQLQPVYLSLAQSAGCDSKGRPQRAKVLHRVFLKFFIGQVQPQLAGFVEQGYQVNKQLRRLQKISNHPPLEEYLDALMALSDGLAKQSQQHVQPWQVFFKRCGYQPGQ